MGHENIQTINQDKDSRLVLKGKLASKQIFPTVVGMPVRMLVGVFLLV